jgi:hypothetical protein
MNGIIKSTIGVSLAGFVVLLATYGKQLAESINALWILTLEASKSAPMGLVSFMIALGLATLSRWFLRKWVPDLKCPLSRDFIIDAAALVMGVTVVWLQMQGGDALDRLNALWIGLAAGLFAPLLYNGLAAVFGLLGRALKNAVVSGDMPR